jgi:prolyl-tRNA editing enzyme YbaK/EbsC (Cys-tRNA(Pro) deacylase)
MMPISQRIKTLLVRGKSDKGSIIAVVIMIYSIDKSKLIKSCLLRANTNIPDHKRS